MAQYDPELAQRFAEMKGLDPGAVQYDPATDTYSGTRVSTTFGGLEKVPFLGDTLRTVYEHQDNPLEAIKHAGLGAVGLVGLGAGLGGAGRAGLTAARGVGRGGALARQNLARALGTVPEGAALPTGVKAAGSAGSRMRPALVDIGARGGGRKALAETLTGQAGKTAAKKGASKAAKKTAAKTAAQTSPRAQAAMQATQGAGAFDDAMALQQAVNTGRVVDTGTKAYKAGQAAGKVGSKVGKALPKGSMRRTMAGGFAGAAAFQGGAAFMASRGENGELTPEAAAFIGQQYGLPEDKVAELELIADNFFKTGRAPDKATALAMVYQPYEEERMRARQMEEDRAAMAMMISAANPLLQQQRERAAANAEILQGLAGDLPPNLRPVANAYAQYQANATTEDAYEDVLASLGEIWNARRNAALEAQEASATQGGFDELLAQLAEEGA